MKEIVNSKTKTRILASFLGVMCFAPSLGIVLAAEAKLSATKTHTSTTRTVYNSKDKQKSAFQKIKDNIKSFIENNPKKLVALSAAAILGYAGYTKFENEFDIRYAGRDLKKIQAMPASDERQRAIKEWMNKYLFLAYAWIQIDMVLHSNEYDNVLLNEGAFPEETITNPHDLKVKTKTFAMMHIEILLEKFYDFDRLAMAHAARCF